MAIVHVPVNLCFDKFKLILEILIEYLPVNVYMLMRSYHHSTNIAKLVEAEKRCIFSPYLDLTCWIHKIMNLFIASSDVQRICFCCLVIQSFCTAWYPTVKSTTFSFLDQWILVYQIASGVHISEVQAYVNTEILWLKICAIICTCTYNWQRKLLYIG